MKKFIGSVVGNFLSILGVSLSGSQLDKIESITSIVCSIVGVSITIIFAVIIPIIKWWKEAKKDGKIDEEEKKEVKNIFLRLFEILKNLFHKNKDKEDDK